MVKREESVYKITCRDIQAVCEEGKAYQYEKSNKSYNINMDYSIIYPNIICNLTGAGKSSFKEAGSIAGICESSFCTDN